MDVSKLLRSVNNVDDYISATQNMSNKYTNTKIQFNMSTVLALKKIRSIEIEYFTKYSENGAAFKILELMLQYPPSNTWGLLGKEIILLIQYWLDALRKHLVVHNSNWWNFLSVILKFMQEIRVKNVNLNNILIEETAEGLLDLVTQKPPDVYQRYRIVQCLNSFCAESSREIRYALKEKFAGYFNKLSSIMANCGDLRTQYSIMETLLRWLLPRQDLAVRKDAAAKWFPSPLYNRQAVHIFLRRPWQNFFKDARDFLNAQNETSDLVTSVLCRKFSIGNVILISDTDRRDYYVDLNCGSKCVSLMLEPKMLDTLNSTMSICDSLTIDEDNTDSVHLYRNAPETAISISLLDPSKMHTSSVIKECDVTIVISSASGLGKVDSALRNIFDTKYQLLMDINEHIQVSPRKRELLTSDTCEDDSRFSHPVEVRRKKHSGYISRPRHPVLWQSPSTASTSSLAMLRDKLTAFPGYRFDKELVSVCAQPQLSCVTEVTEPEGTSVDVSQKTVKITNIGVCHKKNKTAKPGSNSGGNITEERKCFTPVISDNETSVSCLLVATIGSADDSVINDALDRLPKHKDIHTDNIVDLLAEEALNSYKFANDNSTGTYSKNKVLQNKQALVSNTTTDESNTEVFEDTPIVDMNVTTKNTLSTNKNNNTKDNINTNKQTFDIQAVEDFFSHHLAENRNNELVISPTLAKKINETSSETSESFDFLKMDIGTEFNFNELEIVECLNEVVDKVCKDFEKCTEYLNEDIHFENVIIEAGLQLPLNEITNKYIENPTIPSKVNARNKVKGIKLNFRKSKARKNKNKLIIEDVKQMSPIIERESAIETVRVSNIESDTESPLIKRKRKLYSPKDDHKVNEEVGVHISETEEDSVPSAFKVYNKTKSLATSYKEIDSIRKDSIRKLRNKKKSRESKESSVSPRTKKMNDMFDHMKKIENNAENIVLTDKKTRTKKLAVYNFSDSEEEEEFKLNEKTKKVTRITSKTKKPIKTPMRRSQRINKVENKFKEIVKVGKTNAKTKNTKTKKIKTKNTEEITEIESHLEDERMREPVQDLLNTSILIEIPHDDVTEPKPLIDKPEIEIITDNKVEKKSKVKKDLSLKKKIIKNKTLDTNSNRSTESPLPGLIVEAQVHKEAEESVISAMLENFKDICEENIPEVIELNTTQNILNELEEQNNCSPPRLNISHEFDKLKSQIPKKVQKEVYENTKIHSKSSESSDRMEITYNKSDMSIDTIGRSPITAHGVDEQSPPNTKQLTEPLASRDLEVGDLNQSMREYFQKLTNQLNDSVIHLKKHSNASKIEKSNKSTECNSLENSNNNSVCKVPSVSITRLSPQELRRYLPAKLNSVFGSNQSSDSGTSRKTRSQTKGVRTNEKCSTIRENSPIIRKSLISPIKMYGEIEKAKTESSQRDDYVNRIKMMMTRKIIPQSPKSEHNTTVYQISSTKSKPSPQKRKASPILSVAKSRKIYKKNSIDNDSVSEKASSSIHEWFKRNERDNIIESLDLSLKEQMEQVLEKLDTTLSEIHHVTSKKFVGMFVEAQQQLAQVKAERRRVYQEVAARAITDLVTLMDTQFSDLDRRSQELDEKFIENIKEKAKQLIHEDWKQKRAMVTLLQEDIQTVLKHSANKDLNVSSSG